MNWFEKDWVYNIAAAGSVDREFWGPSKGQVGPFKGSEGGIDQDFSPNVRVFDIFTQKSIRCLGSILYKV